MCLHLLLQLQVWQASVMTDTCDHDDFVRLRFGDPCLNLDIVPVCGLTWTFPPPGHGKKCLGIASLEHDMTHEKGRGERLSNAIAVVGVLVKLLWSVKGCRYRQHLVDSRRGQKGRLSNTISQRGF